MPTAEPAPDSRQGRAPQLKARTSFVLGSYGTIAFGRAI